MDATRYEVLAETPNGVEVMTGPVTWQDAQEEIAKFRRWGWKAWARTISR